MELLAWPRDPLFEEPAKTHATCDSTVYGRLLPAVHTFWSQSSSHKRTGLNLIELPIKEGLDYFDRAFYLRPARRTHLAPLDTTRSMTLHIETTPSFNLRRTSNAQTRLLLYARAYHHLALGLLHWLCASLVQLHVSHADTMTPERNVLKVCNALRLQLSTPDSNQRVHATNSFQSLTCRY